jgi:hypothetical protein
MFRSLFAASLLFACAAAPQPPTRTPEPASPARAAPPAPELGQTSSAAGGGTVASGEAEPADTRDAQSPGAPDSVGQTAEAEAPAAPDAPTTPAAPAMIEATLVRRAGKQLRIELSGDAAPALDQRATLLRYFESKPGDKTPLGLLGGLFGGSAKISGWLAIADVRVKKLDGNIVTLEIEAERSKTVVNGKAVNHFSPGAKLRIQATP